MVADMTPNNVKKTIDGFLCSKEKRILILCSMDAKRRDEWLQTIRDSLQNIRDSRRELHTWTHSARIAETIRQRNNLIREVNSVYSQLYYDGDSPLTDDTENSPSFDSNQQLPPQQPNETKSADESNSINSDEKQTSEIAPTNTEDRIAIRGIKDLSLSLGVNPLIVFLEAHLLSRAFFISDDLIQFGTGRLLVDFFDGVKNCAEGKYIFIGDPYSLTYGKPDDCALNLDTVQEVSGLPVEYYIEPLPPKADAKGRENIRTFLAQCIENKLFNKLGYSYDQDTLCMLPKDKVRDLFDTFFLDKTKEESSKILLYSNLDCYNTNKFIKEKYRKADYNSLKEGDLLVAHNNFYVKGQDKSPFFVPNGSFLRVLEVKDRKEHDVSIKQSPNPIKLTYICLKVKLVSKNTTGSPKEEFDVLLLENYLLHWDNLLKEELIARQVQIEQEFREYQKQKRPFKDSSQYQSLTKSLSFNKLESEKQEDIKEKAESNSLNLKDLPDKELKGYLKEYIEESRKILFEAFRKENPYVNALLAMYGWAITVHKAVGCSFEQALLTGEMGNNGISNESYFRWFYTGISSGKKIYLYKAQTIDPLQDCSIRLINDGAITPQKCIRAPEQYTLSDGYAECYSHLTNPNLMFVLEALSQYLEPLDIIYRNGSGQSFGKYLYKVKFFSGEAEALICVDIKGEKAAWAISNIRIERCSNEEMKGKIEEAIKQLTAPEYPIEGLGDFRQEIYRAWWRNFEKIGVSLHLIRTLNYEDILSVQSISGNQTLASLKLYYTQTGFISSIEIRSLDPELNKRIEDVLENSH